jgi:hypothetical protein
MNQGVVTAFHVAFCNFFANRIPIPEPTKPLPIHEDKNANLFSLSKPIRKNTALKAKANNTTPKLILFMYEKIGREEEKCR